MGRRNISDLQEYNEDPRGVFVRRTVKPHPVKYPYTQDKSELPEDYRRPKSHNEI